MQRPKNQVQKHLSQAMSLAVLSGVLTWITLLFFTARKVITPGFRGAYDMSLGPLTLNHFESAPGAQEGNTITMSFEPGLLVYLALWLALGAAIGYLVAKRKK